MITVGSWSRTRTVGNSWGNVHTAWTLVTKDVWVVTGAPC